MAEVSKAFACFGAKEALKEWTFDLHPLGDEDVELKLAYCGVCHSDIHTVLGEWGDQKWPIVPGHELIGYITKVGKNVKQFKIGDRVGVGAQAISCRTCTECHDKKENYCMNGFMGTYGAKLEDGYITKGGYAHFHRAHSHWVFSIPDSISSPEAAPLLCAGSTVWEPLRLASIGPGKKVGVIGIGGLGHLGVQFAAALGAEVTAISSSESKREEVKKLGAKHFLSHKNEKELKANKHTFDMILNTVSAPMDWETIFNLMKPHGIISNVALPEEPMKLPPMCFGRHVLFTGTTVAAPSEIQAMLNFAAKHNIHAMIQVMPLEQCNEAIAKVLRNEARYRIVLSIDPALDQEHTSKRAENH